MTDYLEQAAARAVELAEELSTPLPEDDALAEMQVIRRRIYVAAHLTYMAGLLRGGAAPRRSGWDEQYAFPRKWLNDVVRATPRDAERGRAGEEIMRLQRQLNAREADFQRLNEKLASARTQTAVDNERDALRKSLDHMTQLWRRIEKLVGREFTSPESVIDRVAYLAEQAETSLTERGIIANERNARLRTDAERNVLLRAARAVLADEDPVLEGLRAAVERIERQNETPAEGAARLRVE